MSENTIVYLCDHRNETCSHCDGFCDHTTNIYHARNFERVTDSDNTFREVERPLVELVTSPEQFAKDLRAIQQRMGYDKEEMHVVMDAYLLQVLEELGYEEGVKIFEETPKWYA